MTAPTWRAATLRDIAAIMAIQHVVHPLLQEREAILVNKLELAPAWCRLLIQGTEPVGYGLAHPFLLDQVSPLDTTMEALPASPDCIIIHDVALLPTVRGQGAGQRFIRDIAASAVERGLGALSLVSVYGTYPIWERCGFVTRPLAGLAKKFGPFGDTARYMVASLR